MRYSAFEKLEIIRIVEQSPLPAKRTLDQLGIARRTFYRWYDRYLEGGPEALEDRPSAPSRVWNRIASRIEAFVEHYDHQRYHESLENVTPADAYFGRAPVIIQQRERSKRQTIEHRRSRHRKLAAQHQTPDEARYPLIYAPICAKCSHGGQSARRNRMLGPAME